MASILDIYYLHILALERFLSIDKSRFKIGVIGGGMAGLGAYQLLKKAGLLNLTLLEARSRLGGRLYTINDGIDLGGSWIHGIGPGAQELNHWKG